MKAIYKRTFQEPRIVNVDNTLEGLAGYVGSPIQEFPFAADASVICNGEWRLQGRTVHFAVGGEEFGGPILIVGTDGENYTDLPQPEVIMELLWPTAEHKKRPTPARAGR